jgi:hypothetical protein
LDDVSHFHYEIAKDANNETWDETLAACLVEGSWDEGLGAWRAEAINSLVCLRVLGI